VCILRQGPVAYNTEIPGFEKSNRTLFEPCLCDDLLSPSMRLVLLDDLEDLRRYGHTLPRGFGGACSGTAWYSESS
jgi:hypothetical protein